MTPAASVAFFRNLNLGQRRSPTRAQLLDAFAAAGAGEATSFQANGTVVFTAEDPQVVADRAAASLLPVCGWDDVALVRSVDWVLALEVADVGPNAEVSFFDGPARFPVTLPFEAPNGKLSVVVADQWHAISLNRLERTSFATPVLEELLGVPVTSRGTSTMLRLAAKLR